MIKEKKIIKYFVFLFLAIVFYVGNFNDIKNVSLLTVVGVFVFNIVENLFSKKKSLFYILFHGFVFLFILDRPLISLIKGDEWWYFNDTTIYIVLFILILSLCFLNVGFYTNWEIKNRCNGFFKNINIRVDRLEKGKLLIIGFWMTVVTQVASIAKEAVMLLNDSNYADVYMGIEVDVPFVIAFLSGISVYFMFVYLAMLPTKIKTVIVLVLYVMSGIPGIVTGSRNAFMIKVLFCFLYFVLREVLEKNSKWIGKKEIVAIVAMVPILLVALGILNYTREGMDVPAISVVEIGEDFLYKQGTSFDTLCQTVEYRDRLRDENYVNYTFGALIDFVNYNKVSNILFGTMDFGSGNNKYNGTLSNNLAHRVSYIVLGDSYLTGHGRGTTYFSELYLDFGYLGIILFNFLLGFMLARIEYIFKKGIAQRIILLNCLLYFFMIPRLALFSIFSFSINYYFWISILLWTGIYFMLERQRRKSNG